MLTMTGLDNMAATNTTEVTLTDYTTSVFRHGRGDEVVKSMTAWRKLRGSMQTMQTQMSLRLRADNKACPYSRRTLNTEQPPIPRLSQDNNGGLVADPYHSIYLLTSDH